MNQLVHNQTLKNLSVVKLKKYMCNTVHNRRVAIVMEMEILTHEASRIGSPSSAEQAFASAGGAAPSSAAPVASGNSMAGSSMGGASRGASSSSAPPPDAHIIPIADLHPYQNRWTIKARVTNKSDMRTWKKPTSEGKLFSFDLLDKDGGEIKVTAFNAEADRWFSVIQQGSVYYISTASIKLANKRYSNTNSQYEMTLKPDSDIQPALDGAPEIKTQHFDFTKISEIEDKAADSIVDVIGVVTTIGDLSSITSKRNGNQIAKRDITIVDETGKAVTVTLWAGRAEAFNYPGHPVVAFKGCKVSDFGGKSLSTLSGSSLSVSPDIPEAAHLKGWYETSGITADQVSSISSGGSGGSRTKVVRTFNQIEAQNLGHGDRPDWIWVKGTITYIKSDGTLWYTACPNMLQGDNPRQCAKKVTETGMGKWRCERCNMEFDSIDYRYVLSCSVADHTGSTWVSVFNDAGPAIIGMSAGELQKLKVSGDPGFEAALEEATFKSFNLNLKIKSEVWNDEARTRTNVVAAVPIAFVADGKALLDRIEQYE